MGISEEVEIMYFLNIYIMFFIPSASLVHTRFKNETVMIISQLPFRLYIPRREFALI
jgi:hypothetical protein